jgi:hypothetical protein
VFIPNRSQPGLFEFLGKSNDRWPKAAVNERHLSTQEPTNQNVG